METLKIPAEISSIPTAMEYIENELRKKKIKNKYVLETLLLTEESIVQLIENATGGELNIAVKKGFPMTKIKLSANGKEFVPDAQEISLLDSDGDAESEMAIRSLVFQSYASRIKYVNRNGCNILEIAVGMPEKTITFVTAGVFAASLLSGIMLKLFMSDKACEQLNSYVLIPVMTLFMNSLKMMVAPMMFLSIVTNFSKYSSFGGLSKANIKTVVTFFLTSVIAVLLGLLSFNIIKPGTTSELPFLVSVEGVLGNVGLGSYQDVITGIIPDNIVTPFLEMNSIQLIFIALVCGIALGKAGRYSKFLQNSAQALSTLCDTIAAMFNKIMPVVVFFATLALVLNTELHTLVSLGQMYLTIAVALGFMILYHIFCISCFGRLDPFVLIRKYLTVFKRTFFLGSSVAAIPENIKLCRNKLGINEKICSFTIPFGAMANMDGNCIYLTVASLFVAKICGIEIQGSQFLPFILAVLILSVGAPIAAGSVLICMSMLCSQLGISITAVTLLLGLNSLAEMMLAVFDSFGDIAVSVVVARQEKMLNKEIYYSHI